MPDEFYYVYALKDPTRNPATPFYVGKGTGSRAFDHIVKPDSTRKYARIKEILAVGKKPMVEILVDNISENQALKIEAELISAFGTIETGGLLTNLVLPSGIKKQRPAVIVPHGAVEKAQIGLGLLKDAVLELARANADGITNSDAASVLGLRSDYRNRQKDYLSYSILGLLMREGRIERSENKRHRARE